MEESTNKGGCLKGRKKHETSRQKEKGGCRIGKTGLTKEELNAVRSAEAKVAYLNNL